MGKYLGVAYLLNLIRVYTSHIFVNNLINLFAAAAIIVVFNNSPLIPYYRTTMGTSVSNRQITSQLSSVQYTRYISNEQCHDNISPELKYLIKTLQNELFNYFPANLSPKDDALLASYTKHKAVGSHCLSIYKIFLQQYDSKRTAM